ncbi:histidinol dehydrogenase [Fusibacter paucivorans]|uniref:Histidinol dehydrogenase n=1 Tax=Fusibacter paucivorans TaxID=76009 RepID=A0ABS5PL71_9FIRM|nr:histidinol dehydrogenase [Fusibacter paucivorans]MBS7525622.1 histidinol dehydrogenase [Fusibacter paucivorans]
MTTYIKRASERPQDDLERLSQTVHDIIANVRKEGDHALIAYNTKFDKNPNPILRVTAEAIQSAYQLVSPALIDDMRRAAANIEAFARAQRDSLKDIDSIEVAPGILLGHRVIPVNACCCYVPGGNYPLFSSALMLIIPAKVAGVKNVFACSPVQKHTGKVAPETLVAMDIAGVNGIYQLGGAQAIAAFAYGTEQVPAVDIIVGPGNQYVTEAKRQCYGQVGIDFVAGPSEVMVIADSTADPNLIAADLLGQSEHDLLAKGILITTDESLALQTIKAVETQLALLDTKAIASASWAEYGEVILVSNLDEAVKLANDWAPEHLELCVEDPDSLMPLLTNYGSLFIGEYSAEVFGDYISGTNHTLPTLKAARYTGGVSVGTFLKTVTHQKLSVEAVKVFGPSAANMAHAEGLSAHASAVEQRLIKLKD